MTHPQAALAVKALLDFWADMGLGQAGASDLPRLKTPSRSQAPSPATAPAPGDASRTLREEPKRLNQNPIAEARRIAAAATSLSELRTAIEGFDGCHLKKASKNTVVCDGSFNAEVMIVGEAPGGDEDQTGLPFVGRAGKLLDKMLATIGLSRTENVYITNLIYWRPPGNRDPSPIELQICAPFLARQVELKRPRLLLTAGKFATQAMLGAEEGIMRLRGRKLLYRQDGLASPIKCVPLLHPAYLLRRPEDKAKAWEDLRTIAAICDELGISRGASL